MMSRDFWDQLYSNKNLVYDPRRVFFQDVFRAWVKPGWSCFEVGCYPGRYMIFLAKELQCKVSGIDFTNQLWRLEEFFAEQGIIPEELHHADFRHWRPHRQYDFVYSLGFIEHFANWEHMLAKHVDLVRPGGCSF